MAFSSFVSMRRTIGVLVILGILVGTCAPSSEGSQDWVLFVELVFEKGSRKKTSHRLPSHRFLKHKVWILTFWGGILRILFVVVVLIHRLGSVFLLLVRRVPRCSQAAHCSQCPCLQHWIQNDPLVRRYQRLFQAFAFSFLPTLSPSVIPLEAFLKAYIVMVDQKIQTFTRLRQFLLEHPALTLSIGFRPNQRCMHLSPSSPAWERIPAYAGTLPIPDLIRDTLERRSKG